MILELEVNSNEIIQRKPLVIIMK